MKHKPEAKRARRAAGARSGRKPRSPSGSSRNRSSPPPEAAQAHSASEGGTFGMDFSQMLDFPRKLLSVGADAARSAVTNPASKFVKDHVSESWEDGLRKLESVFDERVAAALTRMGMPSVQELRKLVEGASTRASPKAAAKARRRK